MEGSAFFPIAAYSSLDAITARKAGGPERLAFARDILVPALSFRPQEPPIHPRFSIVQRLPPSFYAVRTMPAPFLIALALDEYTHGEAWVVFS